MHAALIAVVGRRIGYPKVREIDPWFFPDENWMTTMMEETIGGWKIERIEREYRPTKADEGGVEGWVRLMGKRFLDGVQEEERERCVKEICEVLESVCCSPSGGDWFGYVRLRVLARRV